MKTTKVTKLLVVSGMTCPGCELKIENALKKTTGIITVDASYTVETVRITFDSLMIDLPSIVNAVESLDYKVKSINEADKNLHNDDSVSKKRKGIIIALGVFIIIAAIVFLLRNIVDLNLRNLAPGMGYGVLFIIGLITSLHCVFMCGGINLAVCTSFKADSNERLSKLRPSTLYNAGRVISYTITGAIIGGIGSVIDLAPGLRGIVSIVAGAFMVLMGINMLNLFPALRKAIPKMPKAFGNKIYSKIGKSGPFVIGLLNGFMPCGALQSMQIYALGTGSLATGALSMFFFSAGTVPLMFGFGALSSALSESFANKMIKVGAVIIMVMGIVMLMRGISQ